MTKPYRDTSWHRFGEMQNLAPRKMDSVPCVGPGVAVRDPEGSLNLD